jgi:hypothetical protein
MSARPSPGELLGALTGVVPVGIPVGIVLAAGMQETVR